MFPRFYVQHQEFMNEKKRQDNYSFITKSPSGTHNVMRIFLPKKPLSIVTKDAVGNMIENTNRWDALSNTFLLQFTNSADGIQCRNKIMIIQKINSIDLVCT